MSKFSGCDVSKWQGKIDWGKVEKSGIDFVIIREGYGKENPNQIDKQFEENYKGAKSVGIPVGVYHYSYADSVEDAKKEAQFCLKNIKGKQLEYPVVFDIEDKEQLKLNNRQRTDICKAFCDEIEKAGYYAMIYCNLNWWRNYLDNEELKKYDLWLAQWEVEKPSVDCGIWQRTEKGKINGINGNVDLNISYKNYPEIMKSKGLNGFKKNEKKREIIYTVKKGDTLWKLAEEYLGEGTKYKEIKEYNGLKSNTIYVGQKLKIKVG